MSDDSSAHWLEDLRAQVRSTAIADALADVPDLGGTAPVTWITREHHKTLAETPTETETLFVLAGGLLHRLNAQLANEEREATWVGSVECTYDVVPISRESSYSIRLERGRGTKDAKWVKRWWTFAFTPDETGLEIEYSAGTQGKQSPGPDPTPFARALVTAIAQVHARASGEDVPQ